MSEFFFSIFKMIWNLTTNHHHHGLVQVSIISWPPRWPACNHPWFISVCSQISSRMSLLKSYQIICTSLYKSTTSHLIRRKSHHVYNAFSVTSEDLFPWPPWLLLFLPLLLRASLIAQLVKNPPAMQEALVWFLGQEDLLPTLGIGYPLQYSWASLVAQLVKNLPTMREMWVWSLGWEDSLEKGKATHFSILALRISRTV